MSPARHPPVLVVDDSPAIRSRMESYLRDLGYEDVRSSATVREGLELFRERPAEIVFLDLVIDEEHGIDFASKALDEQPLTNVIVMTALPPGHDQVTAVIAEGARGYLPKPVTLSGVESALERLDGETLSEREKERPDDTSYV